MTLYEVKCYHKAKYILVPLKKISIDDLGECMLFIFSKQYLQNLQNNKRLQPKFPIQVLILRPKVKLESEASVYNMLE